MVTVLSITAALCLIIVGLVVLPMPIPLGAIMIVVGLVLLPVVSLLACVTILPLPLGMLGFLLFAALLFVGQLVTAQAVGDEILRRFRPGTWGSPVMSMAVGLVPLALLASVPWVGGLVWLSATVAGGGAIWLQVRELARE